MVSNMVIHFMCPVSIMLVDSTLLMALWWFVTWVAYQPSFMPTLISVTVLHDKVSIHCQAFQRKVSDVRWRRKCHRFYGNCTAPIKTVLNQEKVQSAKIPSNNLELASMMVIFVFHSFHWVWCTLVDRITQQFQAPFFRFWNKTLVNQIEHLSRGSNIFYSRSQC